MKIKTVLVAFLLVVVSSFAIAGEIENKSQDCMVQIFTMKSIDNAAWSSGFLKTGYTAKKQKVNLVWTTAHSLFQDEKDESKFSPITVIKHITKIKDGHAIIDHTIMVPARVIRFSSVKEKDLAVLILDQDESEINFDSSFSKELLTIGDPVFAYGNMYGEYGLPSLAKCYISKFDKSVNFIEDKDVILNQICGPIVSGMSGGAVFDTKGKILGMLKGTLQNNSGYGFYMNYSELISFADKEKWLIDSSVVMPEKISFKK